MRTLDKSIGSYVADMKARGKSFAVIGKYAIAATDYLREESSVSRTAYRQYVKAHAATLALEPHMKEGLLDYISFAGGGYKRKAARRVERMDKLRNVAERNKARIADFLLHLGEEREYSPCTLAIYANSLRQYFSYCNELTNDNARKFISTMSQLGRKPQTLNLYITAIEKFARWEKKTVTLKRPKIQRTLFTDNIPTREEYVRLLATLERNGRRRYYLYVRVLATTGARVSEFLQLRWRDILNGEVTLSCKGGKYRRILFGDALAKEAKAFLKDSGEDADGYVAVGKQGRISSRGLTSILQCWGAKAGVAKEKLHPHAFRHFFAKSYLEKSNNDVVGLADLLGHDSVDTTRIYLQKSDYEQKQEFNRRVTW